MIQATLIQSIIYHVKRLFSADLMFVWGVLGIIVLYSGFLYVTTKGWLVTAEEFSRRRQGNQESRHLTKTQFKPVHKKK